MLLDDDLRLAWRLSRTWPLARRLRMRAGVVLYALGLQRLAVRVALGAPANGAAADARTPMLATERGAKGGRGRKALDNNKSFTGGDSVDYIAGRLKRDHPDLAEDVIAGSLSAHAAAVQAERQPASRAHGGDQGSTPEGRR